VRNAETSKKAQKTAVFQGKLKIFYFLTIRQNIHQTAVEFVQGAQVIIS
jgi:hypothetical protein